MPFIGKTPETGAFRLIDSITTSATDTYALTVQGDHYFPESARNLIVSLNGVTQAPETAYTVSGSHIVFASALTSSDVIDYILVIGDAVDIGTPSDGTVGNAQLKASLDLSGKTLTFSNDQISGDAVDGGTISNFASTGIDDNATSAAITIDSSQNVGIGTTNPTAYSGQTNLNINSGGVSRIDFDISDSLQGYALAESGYLGLIANTSNYLMLGAGNLERLRISSAGDVQIGTAAVTGGRYFDIYNTGSTATDFAITRFITQQVGSSSTTSADIFKRKNGQFGIANNDTHADAYINFKVGATERMRINSSGDISFAGSLNQNHDGGQSFNMTRYDSTIGINNTLGEILFRGTEDNGTTIRNSAKIACQTSENYTPSASGGHLLFYTTPIGSTSITERMRITSDGNVGIGTSEPDDKLHIYSGASGGSPHSYTQLLVESNTHQALEFLSPNTSEQGVWFSDPDTSTVGGISYYHVTNAMSFRTSGDWRMDLSATSAATTLNILSGSEGLIQFKNGGTVKGYINVPNTRFDIVAGTGSSLRLIPDGAGAKAVTVDTSGNFLVGKSQVGFATEGTQILASGELDVTTNNVTSLFVRRNDGTGAGTVVQFYRSSSAAGGINASAGSSPAFFSSSDERLKDNIADHPSELSNIMDLRPVSWDWKDAVRGSGEGFVAQELEQTAWSDLVSEGDDGYKIVAGLGVVETRIIKALQEAVTRIETLEAEVAAFQEQQTIIEDLQTRLSALEAN